MDRFSYFIVFDSLILGLALAELLGGFGMMVRAHALKKLEAQTALMAILILLSIIAQWVDTWAVMRTVTVNLVGFGPPVALAICYYLAATVVFPHREADHERLADYYRERRPFVVTMVMVAVLLDIFSYRHKIIHAFEYKPAVFWLWIVPSNVAFLGAMLALLVFRSRRANIMLLTAAILLLTIQYWSADIGEMIAHHYYPD